ncbi:MAG: GNAT family N-acetyltransferase [Bacteroidales bacterium]|nr:GNAT family N-acetyltransferase [Bacteroidales bacterium]
MEQIIPPARKRALKAELKKARHIPEASRGILQSYLVDAQTCPLVVQEIGRLREIAFREKGGGTGKAVDLDRFDLDPSLGFRQLLVWNVLNNEIMGGYRILTGNRCKLNADGQPDMPSSHLFKFSDTFIKDVLPVTSELSRSYIVSDYQRNSLSAKRSIFVLDCLFTAICALSKEEKMDNFFGKVTFYPDYPKEAFALLTAFLDKYCLDPASVIPYNLYTVPELAEAPDILKYDNYQEDYKALLNWLHTKGYSLPPILKSYMNISPKLDYFRSGVNDEFGNVVEMGLLVKGKELIPERYNKFFKR